MLKAGEEPARRVRFSRISCPAVGRAMVRGLSGL